MVLAEQDQSLFSTLGAVSAVAIACFLIFSYFRERLPRFFLSRQMWCALSPRQHHIPHAAHLLLLLSISGSDPSSSINQAKGSKAMPTWLLCMDSG